jgi:hypothetical protein
MGGKEFPRFLNCSLFQLHKILFSEGESIMVRSVLVPGLLAFALVGVTTITPAPGQGQDKTQKIASSEKDKDWIPLFNGKDLTGWEVYPDGTGPWKVEDGILVGTADKGSHLFTKKDDYRNFHYRIEAKISDKGNSGQYFRTKFGPGYPKGYEAQINSTHPDPIKTGSLYPAFDRKLTAEQRKKIVVLEAPHKPDEWFTQEVIADGNHIIIKVNGKTTVDFVDKNNTYTKGRFALQLHDPTDGVNTKVQFRKIEYKPISLSKKKSAK